MFKFILNLFLLTALVIPQAIYAHDLLQRLENRAANNNRQGETSQLALALYYVQDGPAQDFAKALKWLELPAANDYVDAMVVLASLYRDGKGTDKDLATALHWYIQAADYDMEAAMQAGLAFYHGHGTKVSYERAQSLLEDVFEAKYHQDEIAVPLADIYFSHQSQASTIRAIELLKFAANHSVVSAQVRLGDLYFNGKILRHDYEEAAKWYILSGYVDDKIRYRIGWMYYHGAGLESDGAQALFWLSQISDISAYPLAAFYLGTILETGRDVEQSDSKAASWYKKAADLDVVDAYPKIGWMLYEGKGTKQDIKSALPYLRKAFYKNEKSVKIANLLAGLYFQGKKVDRDYQEALAWFIEVYNLGDESGAYIVGSMYYQGLGVTVDKKAAFDWWLRAADNGEARAQHSLGTLYYKGQGVEHNYALAFNYYKQASEQGYISSWHILAFMYANGQGVERDNIQAYLWYRLAHDAGNAQAAIDAKVVFRDLNTNQHQESQVQLKLWRKKLQKNSSILLDKSSKTEYNF